jgi:hypothetical protein
MRGEGHQGRHCVPPLSPICGSRTYFPWEGVKLDSDYSGSASLIFCSLPPREDLFMYCARISGQSFMSRFCVSFCCHVKHETNCARGLPLQLRR